MAITSKECDNCSIHKHGEGIFDKGKSETFKEMGDPKSPERLTVSDIELEGYWGSDQIELKGDESNSDKLKLDDFEFFLITHIDGDYEFADFSGVIGLGEPQSSNVGWPTTTLIYELYKSE